MLKLSTAQPQLVIFSNKVSNPKVTLTIVNIVNGCIFECLKTHNVIRGTLSLRRLTLLFTAKIPTTQCTVLSTQYSVSSPSIQYLVLSTQYPRQLGVNSLQKSM